MYRHLPHNKYDIVAPHAGAWIEIFAVSIPLQMLKVAPHAGAWIEILKLANKYIGYNVAPHAGAWIEIDWNNLPHSPFQRRSPRGSVD